MTMCFFINSAQSLGQLEELPPARPYFVDVPKILMIAGKSGLAIIIQTTNVRMGNRHGGQKQKIAIIIE